MKKINVNFAGLCKGAKIGRMTSKIFGTIAVIK
jgi:hypothetical protein